MIGDTELVASALLRETVPVARMEDDTVNVALGASRDCVPVEEREAEKVL